MTSQNRNRLGYAVVGCGLIGKVHCHAISVSEHCKLVGCFDVDQVIAHEVSRQFNTRSFRSVEELLSAKDVDVVSIATPTGTHLEVGKLCAYSGKHAIVEKPLEATVAKCEEMVDVFAQCNQHLATLFPHRFRQQVQSIRKLHALKEMGKPTIGSVDLFWYREPAYYTQSKWRGTQELDGGGVLMNQAIHDVDILVHLFGEPTQVNSFQGQVFHRTECEDSIVAIMRFEDGPIVSFAATTACSPGFNRRMALGWTEGLVLFEGFNIAEVRGAISVKIPVSTTRESAKSETFRTAGALSPDLHKLAFDDFAICIFHDRTPEVDGREGLKAVRTIKRIYGTEVFPTSSLKDCCK